MGKKLILYTLLAITFLTTQIKPEIPITNIKGLGSILQEDALVFSPLFGALLWDNTYPRNVYSLCEKDEQGLAQELFYLNPGTGEFRATTKNDKIGFYMTPLIIGKIIGYLENYKKYDGEEPKEKIIKLFNNLEENIIKYKTASKTQQDNERKLNKISSTDTIYTDTISQNIKTALKEKEDTSDKLKQTFGIINPQNIKLRKFIATKKTFLLSISLNKNNVDTYEYLLLSLLWNKTNTKDEFVDYFWGLHSTLQDKDQLFTNDFKNEITKEKIKEYLDQYKDDKYSIEDYERLKKLIEENKNIEEKIINNFENFVFFKLGKYLLSPYPPEISWTSSTYTHGEKKIQFSDCGETSIRNFFNAILWNPKTRSFDIELLKKISTYKPLINYYEQTNKKGKKDIETYLTSANAHDEWTKILSGFEDVEYHKGNVCNISSTNDALGNIVKTISHLINIPEKYKRIDFNTLIEILKTHNIELAPTKEISCKTNNICMRIITPNNELPEITWSFIPGHFTLSFNAQNIVDLTNLNEAMYFQFRSSLSINKKLIFLELFSQPNAMKNPTGQSSKMAPINMLIYDQLLIDGALQNSMNLLHLAIFSEDLNIPEVLYGLIISLQGDIRSNPKIINLFLKLINKVLDNANPAWEFTFINIVKVNIPKQNLSMEDIGLLESIVVKFQEPQHSQGKAILQMIPTSSTLPVALDAKKELLNLYVGTLHKNNKNLTEKEKKQFKTQIGYIQQEITKQEKKEVTEKKQK